MANVTDIMHTQQDSEVERKSNPVSSVLAATNPTAVYSFGILQTLRTLSRFQRSPATPRDAKIAFLDRLKVLLKMSANSYNLSQVNEMLRVGDKVDRNNRSHRHNDKTKSKQRIKSKGSKRVKILSQALTSIAVGDAGSNFGQQFETISTSCLLDKFLE
ncbi:hypothetical protein WN51_14140 [Melipona quadrifasciata]|uniref:Uncharacterized protein n=1 Tax=Melipona quadrifasciata TaxID=166423 RepID=A0A0M8ZZ45_9HYME|nr:hypothetical protein WN51_14140 [Melipona quadrifasciata]